MKKDKKEKECILLECHEPGKVHVSTVGPFCDKHAGEYMVENTKAPSPVEEVSKGEAYPMPATVYKCMVDILKPLIESQQRTEQMVREMHDKLTSQLAEPPKCDKCGGPLYISFTATASNTGYIPFPDIATDKVNTYDPFKPKCPNCDKED